MPQIAFLILAVSAFIASHELLSHPLRAPIVARLGEKGFTLLYSIIALATLALAVQLWRATPPDRLWTIPEWAGWLAVAAMLVAAILFVGSVTAPNPSLMGMPAGGSPRGVQRITRHPMMWSFAIWAAVHIAASADSRTIVLASGIAVLALFGASMQDKKKRGLSPAYADHMRATGFVPFSAQANGRAPWSTAVPGLVATLGGLALWAFLLWSHPILMGASALPLTPLPSGEREGSTASSRWEGEGASFNKA